MLISKWPKKKYRNYDNCFFPLPSCPSGRSQRVQGASKFLDGRFDIFEIQGGDGPSGVLLSLEDSLLVGQIRCLRVGSGGVRRRQRWRLMRKKFPFY